MEIPLWPIFLDIYKVAIALNNYMDTFGQNNLGFMPKASFRVLNRINKTKELANIHKAFKYNKKI